MLRKTSLTIFVALAFAGLMAFCVSAMAADQYPDKPIKLVVPYGAGGGSDTVARIFSAPAKKYLGQNLVVVNIKGSGGAVGSRNVLDAKPDGYTLLLHTQSILTGYHTGVASFLFDDFTPVCALASQPMTIAVRADAPWKTLKDLIADAQKNPGKIKIGADIGGTTHFHVIPIQEASKKAVRVVASGGDSDKLRKLLGGHIDLAPISPSGLLPYIESGKLRCLAVTGDKRLAKLPKVPTYKELGFEETFAQIYAIWAPPKTPKSVVEKLSKAFKEATKDKATAEKLDKLTITPCYMDTADLIDMYYRQDAQIYYLARVSELKPRMKLADKK